MAGSRRESPAPIIDFVPLGYDLDMLEIRLLETYDVVTLFVIYEIPFTHRGIPKPLYFNESVATGRWDRFMDKIVHIIGDEEKLRDKAMQSRKRSWALVLGG